VIRVGKNGRARVRKKDYSLSGEKRGKSKRIMRIGGGKKVLDGRRVKGKGGLVFLKEKRGKKGGKKKRRWERFSSRGAAPGAGRGKRESKRLSRGGEGKTLPDRKENSNFITRQGGEEKEGGSSPFMIELQSGKGAAPFN